LSKKKKKKKAASNVSKSMVLSSAKSSSKEHMNNWLQLPFKQEPALPAQVDTSPNLREPGISCQQPMGFRAFITRPGADPSN
jgi:hypothetical protein